MMLFRFFKTTKFFQFSTGEFAMCKIRRIFAVTVFVCSFVFLSATAADAQAMVSYLFLEVTDANQKPVAGAKIEAPSPYETETETPIKETDEKGSARFESWNRPPDPTAFRILKSGYYSFDLFGLLRGIFNENGFYESRKLKVELLKIPQNKAEKKALGDEQVKRDFFAAVLKGDAAQIRRLLKSKIDPNISTDDLRGVPAPKKIPAMLYAAENADTAAMNEFLAAKVNLRDENSNIRNLLAFYVGSLKNRVSSTNQLPVLNAYVETLLEAGASLNAVNAAGESVLMIAAKQNNVELVGKFIEKGLDVNAKNKNGATALTEMFDFGRDANPDPQKVEIIKLLLKSGADPNVIFNSYDDNCDFLLKTLTRDGQLEFVKLLLSHKANAALKCKNGENVLSNLYGGNTNNYELADVLINAGADVDAAGRNGTTVLMNAAALGNAALVKKLLSKGASVNAQNKFGLTALKVARETMRDAGNRSGFEEIIKLLEAAGAK